MHHHDIMAIGGSRGSLDAVMSLLAKLPGDLPAAVFVTIHVGTFGKDLIGSILDAQTPFAAATAVNGTRVEHGHVYVAPADSHLLVIDGVVRLGTGPRENLARPSIDPLFRSLALAYRSRVIAVVLTGMLDDGAAGLADVKRCGGITVVQNPGDAVEPEIPLNALRATDVDYRTSIADMPAVLMRLVAEPAPPPPPVPPDLALEIDIALGRPVGPNEIARLGQPSPLTCPSCAGVLSTVSESPLRFRCQVGHGFTAESLAAKQEDSVAEALRVAMRIIDERSSLFDQLAANAKRSNLHSAAERFTQRADEYRDYAGVLQKAVQETG